MFYIKGIIKSDKTEDFIRKDGFPVKKRSLHIEPLDSIFPVAVSVPLDKEYGKVGDQVEIKVNVYPFSFVNKQRVKAFLSIYVSEEEEDKK
jgi:hypothetical protein